jgi:hypothetical protein
MKWVFTKSLVDALLISLFFSFSFFLFCMLASHNGIVTQDKVDLTKISMQANMEVWPTPIFLGAKKLTGF